MSDDDPTTAPAAIPWYQSKMFRGIVTIVVTQTFNWVQKKYQIDASLFGITVNDLVDYAMGGISALALASIAHARVTQKTAPAIVATKAQAAAINAIAPTTPPAGVHNEEAPPTTPEPSAPGPGR